MQHSRKEDEERALALAALSLVKATIDALEQGAVLKEGEIQGIFERALVSLEFRAQDGATGLARRIVEGIAITRPSQPPENPSGSQDSN
jgi:phosphohistidine phosphatase SixA